MILWSGSGIIDIQKTCSHYNKTSILEVEGNLCCDDLDALSCFSIGCDAESVIFIRSCQNFDDVGCNLHGQRVRNEWFWATWLCLCSGLHKMLCNGDELNTKTFWARTACSLDAPLLRTRPMHSSASPVAIHTTCCLTERCGHPWSCRTTHTPIQNNMCSPVVCSLERWFTRMSCPHRV